MSKGLVVVESPTKVKTVKKYLGNDYQVAATVGHIKDLPSKELGIEIDNNFNPMYKNIPGKQKVISDLKKMAGEAEDIYLAPDPDREGEAIAWHTAEVLKKKGRRFHRVLFHELTRNGILSAMSAPLELNAHKYEAQKARRILDRLVGYQISPLLWKKVKNGLSAGRVQSVAVRIICERERAIQAFEPEEYWSLTAHLRTADAQIFAAKFVRRNGKKISIPNEIEAKALVDEMEGQTPRVEKVVKKTAKRNPLPPFTTSKLQQEAIRKLRFTAKKTMSVAQELYEGVDLESGEPAGLITYMRTDSTRIAPEAANEALRIIAEQFGPEYAPDKPRFFQNKKKVQDAHEAIRPTSVFNTPEKVGSFLTADQLALYTLVWKRFVASQMQPALIDTHSVTVKMGTCEFSASGSVVRFPGCRALYLSEDEDEGKKETLPELSQGQLLHLNQMEPRQHFTQPPPRFSEASLVQELEENGIGRPSTYAAILSTIRDKGYVELVKGYFRPSELGFIVNDLMVQTFPDIFSVSFTARMEDELDRVESAEMDAADILHRFYPPFQDKLEKAAEEMLSVKGVGLETGLACPECGKELRIKMGKNGHFLACSGYPDCSFSRDYVRDEKGSLQILETETEETVSRTCELCGKPMTMKRGKYGTFLACTGYPECKNTQSASITEGGRSTGVPCPEPGCTGQITERRSKRGNIFYGCSRFPDCKFAIWDKPANRPCPRCGAPFLVEKSSKKEGNYLACLNRECGYREMPDTGEGE
ncbi:MAG: type I DNA topoisomerase [Desulfobacterales bacterium]